MAQQTMADLMSKIGGLPARMMGVVVDDQPAIARKERCRRKHIGRRAGQIADRSGFAGAEFG